MLDTRYSTRIGYRESRPHCVEGQVGRVAIMTVKRLKCAAALTLVEVMVSMVVLATVALGALGYQYYAVRHAEIAQVQTTAIRTAQLLLEDWKSTGGSSEYDPAALGLGFPSELQIPASWSQGQGQGNGTPLHNGVYAIVVDGVPMVIMLNWKDVSQDSVGEITLRQLSVTVDFMERSDGQWDVYFGDAETAPARLGSSLEHIQPIILTTYVRLDASSG